MHYRNGSSIIVVLGVIVSGLGLCSPALAQGDVYMKDTPMDTGVEPNPDMGPMWVTEDVWVRRTPDPGYLPYPFLESSPTWTPLAHQNPEYRDPKYGLPNYVYVRVRNRGTTPSTGTERLRLYFAKASTGLSWPTQWVDYLANDCGPTHLYGMEITKPRKNAATATGAERDAYRDAILALPASSFFGGVSYWRKQDEVHEFGPSNRHHTPAFLPWHREMLDRYEVLLQEQNPLVKLLYWDWTTDPENTGGFNIFTNTFMGASGRGTGGVSIGAPFVPALTPPSITRNLNTNTTPPAISDATVLGNAAYPDFAFDNEYVAHDGSHGYIGGGGNMSYINSATEDPFFFLLHTNVDRLWAQWQRNPSSVSRLDTATTYGTDSANANITTNMAPWNGTGTAIEPWTVAGGYIVSKSPLHPSVVSPPVYDTAPLVIPVLQPNQAVVIQIPWYPPNPANFACFGGDQGHFCLLARIETSTTSPFGMTVAEGASVSTNTRNNNNIVWKNITVVDDFAGALSGAFIIVRNVFTVPTITSLVFANTNEIGASFFDFGQIFVDLQPELFKRWIEGGGVSKGIETVDPERGRIQIFSPDAALQNIRLDPGEAFSLGARFELSPNYRPLPGLRTKWDLIQTGTPGNPDAVVGGQRFEADFQKLVVVPEGGRWRYLDNGSFPGPDWTIPEFDDSKWKRGQAELGFADDPMTTIEGGPPDQRHITSWFRHAFDVDEPGFFRSLFLRLKRDDGAVVYLNGTEVHRANLPAGDVTPDTLAMREVAGLEEEMFFPIRLNLELLRKGRNVVAVEIHQDSRSSEDLSFDMELSANRATSLFPPSVRIVFPRQGALRQAGEVIPILVEALDGDGEIQAVSLFADGERIGIDEQPPFEFQWQGAPPGVHRLRAVAMDNDQQQARAETTFSVVQNTPPMVRLTSPSDGAVFDGGQPVVFKAEAADPGGAIKHVQFFLREAEMFISRDQLVGTTQSPPFEITLENPPPGRFMLTAVATDDGGATSVSIPVHVMFMATAPFTMADVRDSLQFAGGLSPLSPPDLHRFDVAENGRIEMEDSAHILRKVAGLDTNP